jgi:hypothetical protein
MSKKVPYHFLDTPGRVLRTLAEVAGALGDALGTVAVGLAYLVFWTAMATFAVVVMAFFNFRKHWRTLFLVAVAAGELRHHGHPALALVAIPATFLAAKLMAFDGGARKAPGPSEGTAETSTDADVADKGTPKNRRRVAPGEIHVRTVD